jgi:hypothetical protein
MKILNFFYSALVFRLLEGHICAWLIDCVRDIYSLEKEMYVKYFFKNKLRKYVIIRLHNLKLNTDIAHIEPVQN